MLLQYICDEDELELVTDLLDVDIIINGRDDWCAPRYCAADKYGVAGLKSMLIEDMDDDLVLRRGKSRVGVDWQNKFMKGHYHPLRKAFGGSYPAELYPISAKALASYNWRAIPTEKMVAAAMEDVGLNTYLLGGFGHEGEPGRSRALDD